MPFHAPSELVTRLAPAHARLVLSTFPEGSSIASARFFDNYDLPCPVLVEVRMPTGGVERVVLRMCRHGDAAREAELLRTLRRLGLPVPEVLAESPAGDGAAVLSVLPGTSLQALAMESASGLEAAARLLVEAVARLSACTESMEQAAPWLPRRTLAGLLDGVAAPGSPWIEHPAFRHALAVLRPALPGAARPLVFTNGDYQPGNFLAMDGVLTGFVDFESAAFADPLIGFAKFPIYDLHPLNKAGLLPRVLAANGWTPRDFAPRLAIACLATLRREVPLSGGAPRYRNHVLALLRASVAMLSSSGAP